MKDSFEKNKSLKKNSIVTVIFVLIAVVVVAITCGVIYANVKDNPKEVSKINSTNSSESDALDSESISDGTLASSKGSSTSNTTVSTNKSGNSTSNGTSSENKSKNSNSNSTSSANKSKNVNSNSTAYGKSKNSLYGKSSSSSYGKNEDSGADRR